MKNPHIQYVHPEGLSNSPVFTQVVQASGHSKTIFLSGQTSVDKDHNLIGKGDLRAQATRAMANIETALAAAGATLADVVKWNIYVVAGQDATPVYDILAAAREKQPTAPACTFLFVAGMINPDYLIEIEAIAVL